MNKKEKRFFHFVSSSFQAIMVLLIFRLVVNFEIIKLHKNGIVILFEVNKKIWF